VAREKKNLKNSKLEKNKKVDFLVYNTSQPPRCPQKISPVVWPAI